MAVGFIVDRYGGTTTVRFSSVFGGQLGGRQTPFHSSSPVHSLDEVDFPGAAKLPVGEAANPVHTVAQDECTVGWTSAR